MHKYLRQQIVLLYFAIKCLGLTTYSINSKLEFKKTNMGILVNYTIIVLIIIMLFNVKNCVYHYEDVVYVFELISHNIGLLYIIVIIIVFNSKQSLLVNIYQTVINFEKLIIDVSKKPLNIKKLKKNLIRIKMLRNFWIGFFLCAYIGLRTYIGAVSIGCGFQYLLIITLINVTELLLINFFIITVHILKHFNIYLKRHQVSLSLIKKIYGAYFNVKAQLQSFNGVCIFFKFMYCSLNVTGMIYSIMFILEHIYHKQIYILIVVFFTVLNNVFEICSTLYFVNKFYNEVLRLLYKNVFLF